MQDAVKIARYELAYHVSRPATALLVLLLLGQGLAYGVWTIQLNGEASLSIDLSRRTYYVLASAGIGLTAITALLAGQSLTKDIDLRTSSYLYSLPQTASSLLLGRLLGTLLTVLSLGLFYPLGVGLMLWVMVDFNTPPPVLTLLNGYLWLTVGQVVTVTSIALSLTVLLRGIAGAYLTLAGCLLYYLLTDIALLGSYGPGFLQLLDPFGVSLFRAGLPTGTTGELNPDALDWPDEWYLNRMLWLGLSFFLFDQADKRFSYEWFVQKDRFCFRLPRSLSSLLARRRPKRPRLGEGDNLLTNFGRLGRLTGFEVGELSRQPLIWSMATGLAILTLLTGTVFNVSPDVDQLATTARMMALRHPMGALVSLFLVVLTGEVVHHERTLGMGMLYDTLPQSTGLRLLAKLVALSLVAALLVFVIGLTGLFIQVSSGFPLGDNDWWLYAENLMVDLWSQQVQLIALSMLVSVWSNQRFLGHALSIGLVIGLLWGTYQGISPWYLYSVLPGSDRYSDLTGYGTFTNWRPLFSAMWWGLATVFFGLSVVGYSSGIALPLRQRLTGVRSGWSDGYRLPIPAGGCWYVLFLIFSWQVADRPVHQPMIHYRTKTIHLRRDNSRYISISVRYYHPYQADKMLQSGRLALLRGEQLFGRFPFKRLLIEEVPHDPGRPVRTTKGLIQLSEQQGWTAKPDPTRLDYIDYVVTREIMSQWLVHTLRVKDEPGRGLLQMSLPEYLGLQAVGKQYGPHRLSERLGQRAEQYRRFRRQRNKPEPTLVQATHEEYVTRWRAGMVLTSLGQVWGDSALERTIGHFYQARLQMKQGVHGRDFSTYLRGQLPDSLGYLAGYLSNQFTFTFRIGQISRQPTDLAVEVLSRKWAVDHHGQQYSIVPNDWVPIVLIDSNGNERYRALIKAAPDQPPFRLPLIEGVNQVVVDPLGAWPGDNQRTNRKLL